MSRLLLYLGRFVMIAAGYAAGALAASLFLNLLILAALAPAPGEAGPAFTGGLVVSVPFLALFLAYLGFFPAMVAILLGELFRLRGFLYHSLSGGLVGASVLLLFWQNPNPTPAALDSDFLMATVAAGLAGGIAYWLVAGRSAGEWQTPTAPAP